MKTRKVKYIPVDSLDSSFQRISAKVKHMIEKGCTDKSLGECIRRLWSQQFHNDLSAAALKGMIVHYRAVYKSKKTRKQMGGMAPLEYVGGQGSTDHVYGNFPVWGGGSTHYVESLGSAAGQRSFDSSIGKSCTTQQGGRRTRNKKQQGGGIFDDVASAFTGGGIGRSLSMGHPMTSVPPNTLQNITTAVQGRPSSRNSDPTSTVWSMSGQPRSAYDPAATTFNISPVYNKY